MEARLQKWGNSDAVRIPHVMLKSLNLKTNDKITLEQYDDKIVISKSIEKQISLKERFENYSGDNLAEEFVWDEPRGREIW